MQSVTVSICLTSEKCCKGGLLIYPKHWLSCFKAGHRHTAKEFIDDDFAHQLLKRVKDSNYTDTEAIQALDFLHKMNSEYYKNVLKKGDRKAFHRTKKLRQDCYQRENARNRDILSAKRFLVTHLESPVVGSDNEFMSEAFLYPQRSADSHEDVIIDLLDGKNIIEDSTNVES
ncbi:MAG: hypothetical protein HC838_00080 [Spirulinaceae cyanobacterium RM2_2_10]|nr:hypothetical protein [Spirulinaceae cyanobacterium RM2_2_10]